MSSSLRVGKPVQVKLVLAVLLGTALSGCGFLGYPSYIRKMKVTVDLVHEGLDRSGSGVIEITWNSLIPLGPAWNCKVRGDAIPVDVGSFKVISILRQFDKKRVGICHMALSAYGFGIQHTHENLAELASKKGKAQVPDRALPTLVRFVREADPKSATVISASDGVQLRGVTVEMTSGPITRGVIKSLPEVQKLLEGHKGFETSGPGEYDPMPSDFVRGE